jgi:hypothetical protein
MLYLAQAYSKYVHNGGWDEHPAFILARNTVAQLWAMKLEVFSPILYTHPFGVSMDFYADAEPDYVKHDLAHAFGYLNHDAEDQAIDDAYDSGLCMVFADDCLSKIDGFLFVNEQLSHGARMEYIWAVEHNVRCIRLTELLEKRDIYACEVI